MKLTTDFSVQRIYLPFNGINTSVSETKFVSQLVELNEVNLSDKVADIARVMENISFLVKFTEMCCIVSFYETFKTEKA